MKVRRSWEDFADSVSEFTSAGVRKMFRESGIEIEDDDVLELALLGSNLIEITHLGSGEKVSITGRNPSQPPLASGARVW